MGIIDHSVASASPGEAHLNIHAKVTRTNIISIAVAGMGSFVFGYCNNSIAGSFVQETFVEKFLSGRNADSIVGGILGGFLGGGLIGALIQAPISNRFGRRITTGSAAVITMVSGALQAGSVNTGMFMAARVLCGIGAGIVITNCPVYMSEISPPHVRGMLVGNHAISIVFAYMFSSLMALAFNYVQQDYQWRLQFVMLTFFGLMLLLSLFVLPESPRWLCDVGREEEAWIILKRLHQSDHDPDNQLASAEMAQIKVHVEVERTLPTGYMHILRVPQLRHRAACSILVWIMGQSTGILVIANLTPTLFGQLGYGVVLQLGLSVVWTFCALLGCIVNASFMDRVGRVKLLVLGGYLCSVILIFEAVLQKYYVGSTNTAGINAAVAFYFLFIFFYGCTIDCAAPASLAFAQIGWKYYWVMICACVVSSTLMIFICPETTNLTLEEIGAKFGDEVTLQSPTGRRDSKSKTGQISNDEAQIETVELR
ncbi:general substrate transporter [Pleurostoma richardsiae]|uniref:General substrate transporter n=1 Tax=Pleurostoma richardsiae TaxID=41990 RepID=A0AA38VHJ3_9PEZI|nr:general substrate transporter [Pleurostoma richardsiae]